MDQSTSILVRVFAAFALAVIGGIISMAAGVSHRRLCALISLAAGTLLGVTVWAIVPECAETMNWWELTLALASGYVVFQLVSKYVHHVCPACAASHFDEATTHRFSEIASALVVALAIHSTLDGVAVAVGQSTHAATDWSLLAAVCIHKVPEGLALGALLLGAGYSRKRALVWVTLVEATTVLGGVIGIWWLPGASTWWINAVLAHAGGGFVFLALHAVFGELVKHGRGAVLANFGIGFMLLAILRWMTHAH